ncbi:hypothetical protein CONPUDRAFT_166576 [Coniophora puteana RWD-64-598 SS2]|uniref:Uncharacterized protein n=1 Tax=Coniophora puteana (strain RWD-64-598) TaxID=741705 RepID=A0A5M3MMI3_CONPW|nr:uncharacterized protein CONPUDRAFT_166576 [Coniophora puteana RWD-64-598 SS2]EIW79905.1 hypothetical protein CONPUDRAFT_166576 [Coniophora puteana RWD-64-598 SS2]
MSDYTAATVSLEQLRGSRATFLPKRIELLASGDYSAMLGLASGPTPSGQPPTCQPNNGLFPSFVVETRTGSRSLTKDHAELVFDPVIGQVRLTNWANHKGTIIFRGVPRYSEDILTTTVYSAKTMPKGVKAFILENPGDEHVLQNGDIIDGGAHPPMRDGDRLPNSRSSRVGGRKASSQVVNGT